MTPALPSYAIHTLPANLDKSVSEVYQKKKKKESAVLELSAESLSCRFALTKGRRTSEIHVLISQRELCWSK